MEIAKSSRAFRAVKLMLLRKGVKKMENSRNLYPSILGLMLLFLALLLTLPVHAADITPVGSWTTGLTHTVGAGTDRLLVFVTGFENGSDPDVTGVSYGGVAMTQAVENSITTPNGVVARSEIWYLDETGIQAASGNTFVVTYSSSPPSNPLHAAATFANVDQLGPIYSTAQNQTTSVDPIEATVNVLTGGMAISGAVCGNGGSYSWGNGWIEATDQVHANTVTMATAEHPAATTGTDTASADYSANISRQVIVVASLAPSSGGDCEDTFAYRKMITIDHSKVSGTSDLVDFPVAVRLTGTDFQEIEDNTRSDGYDIVFRASDGITQLAHEIEVYDETNDELVAWVRIPNLSSTTDTDIYLYYGSSCVTAPTGIPNAVWDSHFRGVWHLKEDPTGMAPQMTDSTANNNHGTAMDNPWNLWTSSNRVQGKIGPALYFHDEGGSQKQIDLGTDPSLDVSTAMTLEAWIKNDSVEAANRYIFFKSSAYMLSPMRGYNTTPNVYVYITGHTWVSRHAYDNLTTGWDHLVGTYDSADQTLRVYINGELNRSRTLSGLPDYTINASTNRLRLSRYVEGIIDEARVSDVARSAEWIKTSYDNQNSPSTFYSVGAEEALDPDAPSITITGPTSRSTYSTEAGTIDLDGIASGTWGIVNVTWSNTRTGGSGNCMGTNNWSASISLAEGDNLIIVTAYDSHDNTASDLIAVEYAPPLPDPEPEPDPESNPDPDAPGDTEIFSNTLEPNVMILLDTSGSMNGVIWLDAFDPNYDYSTPLLSQGKQVVFAQTTDCAPDASNVRYITSAPNVRLRYNNYTDPGNICSGSSPAITQDTEGDSYFHFRRDTGEFVTKATYDANSGDPDFIKVWLPHAEYSVDPPDGNHVTRYHYNYLNWIFYYSTQADRDALEAQHFVPEQRAVVTRWLTAKKAVIDLVASNPEVRFGLMRFEGDTGGAILCAVPASNEAVVNNLNNIQPAGYTPLSEALEDAWDYFRGVEVSGEQFNLKYYCRRNFVIVVTDGIPTHDGDNLSASMKKDWDGDNGGTEANGWTGDEDNFYIYQGSDYLDDVAFYMQHNDGWTDETKYPGIQNVGTYTIGFTLDHGLLQEAASNGGGQYYTANDLQGLNASLQGIVQEIIDITYSYSAPVVPVSQMERTSSGSNIYLALFKPTLNAFWKGNIKKFGIATADVGGIKKGDILDRNGVRATDDAGHILDTAVSYWGSADPDGGDAGKGGVGEVLLNRATPRNIYTWLDKTKLSLNDPNNAFTQTNTWLTRERLGAADDEEKNDIIDFVHGKDAYDDDRDSDTDEKRNWILGDFLHSRPLVLSYNEDTTVIFSGANDGMLHAFWDGNAAYDGGTELWAYIPPMLLPKLKYLAATSSHGYFVDGSPQVYVIDANHDGNIQAGTDQAILICGLRRGGRAYFALDVTDPHNPKIPTGWAKWGMWKSEESWQATGMIGAGMSLTAEDEEDATFPYEEMGQSWPTPVFGKINYGGSPKDAAFIGAGYSTNQDQADPSLVNEDMGRGIYLVDPLTGDRLWSYTKYPDDLELDWSIPSDIAAIDTVGNGYIDRLYVGDMGGQLWRFDIGNPDSSTWDNKVKMLFDANALDGAGRKIFYAPDITLEEGYELVFFGTGDRAHPKSGSPINRIYAVKDANPASTLNEGDLKDVTDDCLQDPSCGLDKDVLRNEILTGNGWYIRLVDNNGEKVLAAPLVFGGVVYFTTFTPTGTDDPCVFQEGLGRLYSLDHKTGEAVLNYDGTTEGLTKSDRSLVIGSAIPSRVVVALIHGQPEAYIGIRGGIVNPDIGASNPLIRIFWRQLY